MQTASLAISKASSMAEQANAEENQISVEAGSVSVNTLYNLLLNAGPTLDSVNAPFLLADFCAVQLN